MTMKIAVVGGGAAGLMAAIVASQNHKVTVFEKQSRVGKKLYASGNGKCNMTNSLLTRENLEKPNDFYNCQQANDVVSKFDYNDFMQFCKDTLAIETITDSQGRVYPRSEQGGSVLDAFRLKCQKNNVKINDVCEVTRIEKTSTGFKLQVGNNETAFFDKVIFCVGSSAQVRNFNSLDLLKGFDLSITKKQASLTPVKTEKVWLPLNGTKVKCNVSLYQNGQKVMGEDGEVLFRDYGLSGIVIFNVSAYIARNIVNNVYANYYVMLDLFPEFTQKQLEEKLFDRIAVCGKDSKTFFVGLLCNKLANEVIKACKLGEQVKNEDITKIAKFLKNIRFDISGLCGEDKGQVMSGGIDFACVDENLQCKNVPGLYFAGECLNADGLCGGFNLHFAFSSGYIAGKSV